MHIAQLVQSQRAYFAAGNTLDVAWRKGCLRKLEACIRASEEKICAAVARDLGKHPFETVETEIALVLEEIRFALRHLDGWARARRVRTPIAHFPSRSYIVPEPYGVCLILAPWNYPFQLAFSPLVGAVAAGNCVLLRGSSSAPHVADVMQDIARQCFAPEHVTVLGREVESSAAVWEARYDHIFFTGSVPVGKIVMAQAARHLTPVVLELGGKSPCIVARDCDVQIAARRILWGKCINAGQTCVAPDYCLVEAPVAQALLDAMKKELHHFYGDNPLESGDLARIVNEKQYRRLRALMQGMRIAAGGRMDDGALRIEPTLLMDCPLDAPIMQEEIFGPLLPVISVKSIAQALEIVAGYEKPLALYLFTADKALQRRIVRSVPFGGGCINDTVVHLATPHLPFGGVGYSGMGQYHGKRSFDCFSHPKSVLQKARHTDVMLRYPPYSEQKFRWLRRIMLR
nr:aldehyde dehydrogenase [Maliibacterium massiliense]